MAHFVVPLILAVILATVDVTNGKRNAAQNNTIHHCYVGDEHHYAKQECNFLDTSCFIVNCTGGMSRGCASLGCGWSWLRAKLCGGDHVCCDEDFCNGPPNILW